MLPTVHGFCISKFNLDLVWKLALLIQKIVLSDFFFQKFEEFFNLIDYF